MKRVLLTLFLLVGAASAHSELERASPGQGAVVTALPREVVLEFSEPLELAFSTFKVYPLGADLAETDAQRLGGLAGALVGDVLSARGDEAARADAGVVKGERTGARVVLALKADLGPGHYVVMWRGPSVDTHTSSGFYLFTYRP